MKTARALVAITPGLAEVLRVDWKRAALFYARLQITEAQFRTGVSADGYEGQPARVGGS